MEHGKFTAELGRKLTARIESADRKELRVFFDHGDSGESMRVVPYFDDYDLSTTLAFVDIAIVDEDTKSVLVLCEVEEEGVNPKKVIGDCCNILISDSVCIQKKSYDVSDATFLLGVKVPERGKSSQKISNLKSRIQDSLREESLRSIKLEFICEPNCRSLINRLETRICGIVCV